ncbi:hypothetical protein SAMN05428642_102826 [Flaviramulus basaltis]|uniref:Uncharacterized protein n=1 Tax=Flaviramulus basaltis TaxID=369401 RepID=A0A1K2IJM5_9FLAO|nr:hypothetical protein [Flaviramulus basaltis]SFZ92612.1 hypothetical protein SAMN05428642_102826 [Flaviramulus basaltis]
MDNIIFLYEIDTNSDEKEHFRLSLTNIDKLTGNLSFQKPIKSAFDLCDKKVYLSISIRKPNRYSIISIPNIFMKALVLKGNNNRQYYVNFEGIETIPNTKLKYLVGKMKCRNF